MAHTVDDIQASVAAVVDQDEDTSNISSDDYSLRLDFINQRERKWSEVGRWRALYKEYSTLTSTSSGNVTVALPADFRVEAGFPQAYSNGAMREFSVVKGTQKEQYASTDDYVSIQGNPHSGYYMVFRPGVSGYQLGSGASIYLSYYSVPTSLASPADTITCPNPDYIITGVISDVWEAREDARFQIKKGEADVILKDMLEFEMTHSEASDDDRIKPYEQTRYNFKWGRD
jgi:hypothetical protein